MSDTCNIVVGYPIMNTGLSRILGIGYEKEVLMGSNRIRYTEKTHGNGI